jgi:predicted transcriptional regulator
MAARTREIEIESDTADLLEARAAACEDSASKPLAELVEPMAEMKRPVELDDDADAVLRRLARERGTAPDWIASQAVRLFDELYGQAELDELNRRWAEFERSGECYSSEEVQAWLKTWGTRDYRPFRHSPACQL